MATSSRVMVLFCIILCAVALEQPPPRARRSKRDTMVSSMLSFFSNVDKQLASMEVNWKNSTEEQLAQLEAKMEEEMQEKQQHMEKRLQSVQDGMQRLESMVMELLSSRLESMVTEILTSKLKASEEKVAELVEAKTNATEERLASLEASNTEAQASPASCRYQYLYRYEKEAPRSSGDQQGMTKLETELTRLQEKMSALDNRLKDNDHTLGTLHNASVLAMEGLVDSLTQLVATSEQSLISTVENATDSFNENIAITINATFSTAISDLKASLLANQETSVTLFNASIARAEQMTRELTTRMSAVEDKLDSSTSVQAEVIGKTRTKCEDIQKQIADLKNHTTEVSGPVRYIRTCQTYYEEGQRTSGVYRLQLHDSQGPMEVFCDMSKGAGWVVFQRRRDGSVNFYRNWTSYEEGFGDLLREFWLGNRNIHRLNRAGLTQLRVDLQAWDGSTAYASYSHFSVGNASSFYNLSVSGYSGSAGDSLKHNNGRQFSTFDQDHDTYSGNCAQKYKGAWWYAGCTNANLNAEYGSRGSSGVQYVYWYDWLYYQSLQRTELKLK